LNLCLRQRRGVCLKKKNSRSAINVTWRNLRPRSQTVTAAHHVYFRATDESPARFRIRMTNVYCRLGQKRSLDLAFSLLSISFCPSRTFVFVVTTRHSRTHSKFALCLRIDASLRKGIFTISVRAGA
jgi:hypothetical protein